MAVLAHDGIGAVRMRFPLPCKSTIAHRPSRCWMCSNVRSETSLLLRPHEAGSGSCAERWDQAEIGGLISAPRLARAPKQTFEPGRGFQLQGDKRSPGPTTHAARCDRDRCLKSQGSECRGVG